MLRKSPVKSLFRSLRFFAAPLLVTSMLSIELPSVAVSQERPAASDSWTESSGAKTIKAEFIKLEGVNLTVRMSDGTEKVIPLSKLDDKSRLKAREMAKSGAKPSATVGETNKGLAKSTSSDSKLSTPVSFPSNPTAQEFMDIIIREFKNENPMVVWDALPASKQKQIQELLKLASTRIEQRTMNSIKKFRSDLLTAAKGKKQFVLNSSQLPIPPDQRKMLGTSYDSVVGLIEAFLPEDWMDISYLQQSEVRDLLASFIEKVAARAKEVEKLLPSDGPLRAMLAQTPTSAKVESVNSKEAMVTMVVPDKPTGPEKFILSEGRWLPEFLLSGWDQGLGQAKAVLEQANPKDVHKMVSQGLLAVNILLGTVTNAETQEDFDAAIGQVIGMAQGPSRR